jgi:hypothetical protein
VETWKSKLILNFTATSLGIPSILMPYFTSLEKLVEDRIPNDMWVMEDIQKIICCWDFKLETQYLLHYNMHNFNHTGNETNIRVNVSVKKDLLFFLL